MWGEPASSREPSFHAHRATSSPKAEGQGCQDSRSEASREGVMVGALQSGTSPRLRISVLATTGDPGSLGAKYTSRVLHVQPAEVRQSLGCEASAADLDRADLRGRATPTLPEARLSRVGSLSTLPSRVS